MASSDACSRGLRTAAGWCAAVAVVLTALGTASQFALWRLALSPSALPQRDRPYGWLTDRLLQATAHGLFMLAVLAAVAALIAGIAWRMRRRRSDGAVGVDGQAESARTEARTE